MILRPYQSQAIDDLRNALRLGYRRPLLMSPTGAGKTVIAAKIIESALSKGRKVTFTVPAISLVDQTARAFWDAGIRDIGIMQASHAQTDPSKPVQIATVQTLARREIPESHLWIIDEAHRLDAGITKMLGEDRWAGVPFIGLSATPWAKGLGRLFDKLIIATTTAELIAQGHLSPFRVFAPAHPDLTGVKVQAGDYQVEQLSKAMQAGSLVADIVTTWKRLGAGRPTICFAVDCAHAQAIQRQFLAAGVTCGYQDAKTPGEEREAIRRQFERADLAVVVNVATLTTGVDWPHIGCIIFARPTKSEMLFVQCIGRGLRRSPGKVDCMVIDHSDTTLRLGFVTDIQHDVLDGGRMDEASEAKEREKPLPKECPACSLLKPAGVAKCPSCGFEAKRQSKVSVVKGDITEIDPKRANRQATWPDKVSFIAQVRCYQKQTGKSDGWVAHTYKAAFGCWPNDPRVKYQGAAVRVTDEIFAWIKHRNIAFAKRRGVGGGHQAVG